MVWRIWLPVVVPALALAPLVGALHWTTALSHLYSATHAHPDMEDVKKRRNSFPPDWKQISGGSNLSADSLAQVHNDNSGPAEIQIPHCRINKEAY